MKRILKALGLGAVTSSEATVAPIRGRSDIVAQLHVQARRVVYEKYRRKLIIDDKANIEQGVKLQDCLLVSFYWYTVEFMERANVSTPNELTGSDQAIVVCMALAFGASDAEYTTHCTHMLPVHITKADGFRQRWREAAAKQVEIDKVFRNAGVRHFEARVAAEKKAEAIHSVPDLADAYAIGLAALRSGQQLAVDDAPLYFLLPYSVHRARTVARQQPPDWAEAPAFAELTGDERQVVGYMHLLLANLSDSGVHMDLISKRIDIGEVIGCFPSLAAAAVGQGYDAIALRHGNLASDLSYSKDLFDNVTAFHFLWMGVVGGEA
ncbi:MAG: hypothetical protein COB65_00295 [Thalassobium sp.]|uniref:hypothetical protein n=1 Tax=Octadecabacter sp. SW4 TaxID=2602067 RepID=UPI000C0FB112|nr:hypothetical protein [Octadecabacter sp. SW4]PHQ86881.1 MAG: hypothetical protein COB65_00295 [Thalassobium sp.]QEE34529.1 hypothetical protein FTO60_01680 [Octadecabacter sp. SW4]